MKTIRWNQAKSSIISENPNRGVSLELIAEFIQSGSVLDIIDRPKYPDQNCFVVQIDDEVWCVPFREDEDHIFLITGWPDRKLKKRYLL